jgi:alpha-beta hydrolase superfamily lysophospholipase
MAVANRFSIELERSGPIRISASFAGPLTPEAIVVLCHGVCEHRGRYQRFIERCTTEKLAVISFDLQGHGTSSGKRGHVESFDAYLEDLHQVTQYRDRLSQQLGFRGKSFLFGHSMGGVIVTRYLQEQGGDAGYSGVLLSSAGFVPAVFIGAYKRLLGRFAQSLLPAFRVPTGIAAREITTDIEEQRAYATDPMVTSKVSLRWFREFERAGQVSLRRAAEMTLPLYAFCGSDDRVVSTAAIERFVEAVGATDKTFRCWPGLRHETLNEGPEARELVISALLDWLKARL